MMERTPVASTNLASVGYDFTHKVLEVEFQHGGVYQYFDVPPAAYAELLAAESHGRYFDQFIKKGGYRYLRIQ